VETRLRQLEGKLLANDSAKVRGKGDIPKYDPARQGAAGAAVLTTPKSYNPDADVTASAGKEEKKKKKVRAWGKRAFEVDVCNVFCQHSLLTW
jgi:hypothetical protein